MTDRISRPLGLIGSPTRTALAKEGSPPGVMGIQGDTTLNDRGLWARAHPGPTGRVIFRHHCAGFFAALSFIE